MLVIDVLSKSQMPGRSLDRQTGGQLLFYLDFHYTLAEGGRWHRRLKVASSPL